MSEFPMSGLLPCQLTLIRVPKRCAKSHPLNFPRNVKCLLKRRILKCNDFLSVVSIQTGLSYAKHFSDRPAPLRELKRKLLSPITMFNTIWIVSYLKSNTLSWKFVNHFQLAQKIRRKRVLLKTNIKRKKLAFFKWMINQKTV